MPVVPYLFFYAMAPTAGFEPTTDRLTADCSTAELCRNLHAPLSRNMRILAPASILVKPLKAKRYIFFVCFCILAQFSV